MPTLCAAIFTIFRIWTKLFGLENDLISQFRETTISFNKYCNICPRQDRDIFVKPIPSREKEENRITRRSRRDLSSFITTI